jgi:uncharacterized phage protein (TIGR01671 family)
MREIKFRAWTGNYWINEGMIQDYQDTTYVGANGWDEFPIMQFTGVKDEKGINMYEGDIVKRSETSCDGCLSIATYKVIFKNYSFCLEVIKSRIIKVGTIVHCLDGVVVIGNIYENPELI